MASSYEYMPVFKQKQCESSFLCGNRNIIWHWDLPSLYHFGGVKPGKQKNGYFDHPLSCHFCWRKSRGGWIVQNHSCQPLVVSTPLKRMLVKIGRFCIGRGESKKYFETTTSLPIISLISLASHHSSQQSFWLQTSASGSDHTSPLNHRVGVRPVVGDVFFTTSADFWPRFFLWQVIITIIPIYQFPCFSFISQNNLHGQIEAWQGQNTISAPLKVILNTLKTAQMEKMIYSTNIIASSHIHLVIPKNSSRNRFSPRVSFFRVTRKK